MISMDKVENWEWEKKKSSSVRVIGELRQGKDLANELKKHLHSREASTLLIHQILSCYDNALALFHHYNPQTQHLLQLQQQDAHKESYLHAPAPPRKRLPKKSKPVVQCSKTTAGDDAHIEKDGFQWRKYGQKAILGSIHPRAYYRCTHRYTRGCLATKLVQRSDQDPSHLDLLYKGSHSCGGRVHNRPRNKKPNLLHQQHNMTTLTQQQQALMMLSTTDQPINNDFVPSMVSAENVKTDQFVSEPISRNIVATTSAHSLGYSLPSLRESSFPDPDIMDFPIQDLNMILFDTVDNFDNTMF